MKKSKKFVVCGIVACVAGIVFGIAVALCGFSRAQGAVVSKAEGIVQDCGIIVGVAEQWYAKEAEFQSPISYHSPFYDVDFDFVFTHRESGTELKIPAFWDGDNTFKVRFALTELGEWNYTIRCSDESNGLNGAQGNVTCTAYTGDHEIYKRGFVKPTGRYFSYADGTPFFYLGDTHWHMALEDIDHPETQADGTVASRFEYTLMKRKEQGFTVIQSEPLGHYVKDNNYFQDIFKKKFNKTQLERFQQYDKYFKMIADMGFVHANAQLGYPDTLGDVIYKISVDHLQRLCRYWVARYSAYPVMWTLAQECDNDYYYGSAQVQFTDENNPWKDVAAYMHKYDPYGHPMTAHQENSGNTVASNSAFKDVEGHNWWASQINYNWSDGTHFNDYKDYWVRGNGKPAILYEGAYDHYWTGTIGARLQGWMAFLNGMYGYGYGSQKIWSANDDHGVWAGAYAETPINTGLEVITAKDQKITWQESLQLPAATQLSYMKNFLIEHQWQNLDPCFEFQEYFLPDEGINNRYAAAHDNNDMIIVYLYNDSTASGTLKHLEDGKTYKCRWFDPETGSYVKEFYAVGNEDNLLYLGEKPGQGHYVFSAVICDESSATQPITDAAPIPKGNDKLFIALGIIAAVTIIIAVISGVIFRKKITASRKSLRSSVRKEMLALRKNTPPELQEAESKAIFEKIYAMPEYAAATEVFLYASVNGEVATENFAKKALADGKKLAYPVSEKGCSDMEFYYVNDLSELTPGFMKIPEPMASDDNIAIPSTERPAIIIVPGVAFDKNRNRLGYGAGYYDKYLAIHGNAFTKTIAVSYSFQILEKLPAESHDIKPDVVVTGNRIIE